MTLIEHLATGCTTVCRCWGVTRRDGVKLGFTDHDQDLTFEGFTFSAGSGLTGTVLEQSSGMAVNNAEAIGALSADSVTEADLHAGRYFDAHVEVWLVNWSDVSQRMLRFRGSIGEVTQTGISFRAELRGLTDVLNRPRRRVYQKSCSAILGDDRCKVPLHDPQFSAELTILAHLGPGAVLVDTGSYVDGWFALGSIAFLDGAASGISCMVQADRITSEGREISFWEKGTLSSSAGNRVRLTAGCNRTAATCQSKFGNFLNFRGFPDLPGDDWLTSLPMHRGTRNGKSRKWR